jgi:hypothetical protein
MKPFDQMDAWWVSCVRVTAWGGHIGFHQKGRQTIVMPEAEQLVFLSLRRHAKGVLDPCIST